MSDPLHNWRVGDSLRAEWLREMTAAIVGSIVGGAGIKVTKNGRNIVISQSGVQRLTMPRKVPARIVSVNTSDPNSTRYGAVADQDTSISVADAVPYDRFAPSIHLNNRVVNEACDIMIMHNGQQLLIAYESGKMTDCGRAAATAPGRSFQPSPLRLQAMLA